MGQPSSGARWSVTGRSATQLAILLLVGLLLRVSTFGDPNLYIDDSWYLFVGNEMHKGAVVYLDIWDRKPLGIFLAYWAFAFFRNDVLAYQIGAWISVSFTAFVITRIALRWCSATAALLAGCTYIATAGVLLGFGGQTPVFYNSLVAGAALLVLRFLSERKPWQLHLAMLLLGIALTFKQTVVFEASFFGLLALAHHRDPRKAVLSLALGVLPFALIAAWYWREGHWAQFYHAMITANLERPSRPLEVLAGNALMLAIELAPLLVANVYAFLFCKGAFPTRIMGLWLAASFLGFLSVPYFVEHYALPALVPLSIVAAVAYDARPLGLLFAVGVLTPAVILSAPYDFDRHERSRAAFEQIVEAIKATNSGERLLVYDGPPLLYQAVGARPMSPLAFPDAIASRFEKDTSPIPTVPELHRLIALRPTAVVMLTIPQIPADDKTYLQLVDYVRTTCAPPLEVDIIDPFEVPKPHLVYTNCGQPGRRQAGASSA